MGYLHNYPISSRAQALPLQAAAGPRQCMCRCAEAAEGQMSLRRREFIAGLGGLASCRTRAAAGDAGAGV